ncbi:regulatory protein, SpoVG family [Candidatus Phytoplasma mali]|uniref:Regulatory protein, SpoVG family n=1 Tax=Phytoplasma mali (strain AT) TaxID=482235 RepID=B3QZM7_PHYMT|nr:SpoVG family protein [Candidatus Phytoplasma mali]CAP18414.1 regulatory protein, SpoVG family [Candidatus Phytoplasma mali]
MQITNVRIILIKDDASVLKGIASVIFDDVFLVRDIRIIENEKGMFISMPSKKTAKGIIKNIAHPLNAETRKMMEIEIYKAYDLKKQDLANDNQEKTELN